MAIKFIPFVAGLTLLASCQNAGQNTETKTTDSTAVVQKRAPLAMTDVTGSPEFPDAQLSFGAVTTEKAGDSAKVSFNFNVKNYELKNQTTDAGNKMCNNSDKGQHIHFILDNKPYVALYEPKYETSLPLNSEHYLLVFLSRSYHESIKSKGAAAIYHFKIDESGKLTKMDEPKTPMIFYSRPKGDYVGKANTDNLLFDFYVWNTNLSADGYKVKANIKGDGLDTTVMITDWKARFLKNMPMGKSSISLTLMDKDGKQANGPETNVSRDFNLAADEPMK